MNAQTDRQRWMQALWRAGNNLYHAKQAGIAHCGRIRMDNLDDDAVKALADCESLWVQVAELRERIGNLPAATIEQAAAAANANAIIEAAQGESK